MTEQNSFDQKHLMVWFDNLKGIKVTKNNTSDVAKWVGPNAKTIRIDNVPRIVLATNRGDLLLEIGDFVTIDVEGHFKVIRISPADTHKTAFEEVRGVKLSGSAPNIGLAYNPEANNEMARAAFEITHGRHFPTAGQPRFA